MHLLVAISSHGYGHLAQCRTLIWSLLNNGFNGKISIQCEYDSAFIRARLGLNSIDIYHLATEPTIPMRDVLTVDKERLLEKYRFDNAFNDQRLAENQSLQRKINCDAVISNVGFYPLWAAQTDHRANAAFCCLNWADIIDYYAHDDRKTSVDKMRTIYSSADFFALVRPFMPANWLANKIALDPIITPNQHGYLAVKDSFNPNDIKHVFITSSDHALPIDLNELPRIDDIFWYVNGDFAPSRSDMKTTNRVDFDTAFEESDIVITKPGYGLFTECAWRQKPLISINRLDWPEQRPLLDWMRQYSRIAEIPLNEFSTDRIVTAIHTLKTAAAPQPFTVGNDDLAKLVMNWH